MTIITLLTTNDNYINFLYLFLSVFIIYLLTLKVTLQLLKSPKDKNEDLLFSKLQFNSFPLISTVSCSDSTLPVCGFGPKITLTCEITLSSAFSYFSKTSNMWPVLSRIHLLSIHFAPQSCGLTHIWQNFIQTVYTHRTFIE